MSAVSLGPFTLQTPIATGGTGVVWRGEHVDQRVSVAVKVLESDVDPSIFRNEVQAVAALNHPGVVMVFDHGRVDTEAHRASGSRLDEGSAWLAMEYASNGSLKTLKQRLPWSQIRPLLMSLLDALAHAHARGVVHRDLKPGNILLGSADDLRPGIKLADFGLAHAVERFHEEHEVRGTPVYMAPEQFRGAWRSFGPWTDLYALGVIAWELVTGYPPFTDQDPRQLRAAHLRGMVPVLSPVVPIPDGFEDWVRRLLATNPVDRFQRAADAAWVLAGLPEPDVDVDPVACTRELISNPTLTLDDTLVLRTGASTTEMLDAAEDAPPPVRTTQFAPVIAPPLPNTWIHPNTPTPPLQMLGVGLNLFGLRTVPLVDRFKERDQIWGTLLDANRTGRTHLAILKGAAGNGKSRLVEWVSQRAHEVGGATILRAIHGPTGGPMDGLAAMVARHFRCVGLERNGVETHLPQHIDAPQGEDLAALAELICPASEERTNVVRLEGATERWMVVEQILGVLARTRPVLLWLDDLQWGPDALAFAQWLLERPPVGPVLILATAQEEALAERPEAEAAITRLGRGGASAIPIGPLPPGDREDLVRALLGLEGELARELADRTGGNPLFTVQLVGDWVARGVLVPGRNGFRLKPGERAALPDDLHQVWSARLDRLLTEQPASARLALELAAALGQEVQLEEWRATCKTAGIAAPISLIQALVKARLATWAEEGWAFSHGMLRESLHRLSDEAGRWAGHNRTCALSLAADGQRGKSTRLGRHWFAAREYARAAELLRRGAAEQSRLGDSRVAVTALTLCEDALRRAGVADNDKRWGELWLQRGQIQLVVGDLDTALRDGRRVVTYARRHHWHDLVGCGHKNIGDVWQKRGDLQMAMQSYQRAVQDYRARGDEQLGYGLIRLGHTRILAGSPDEAAQNLTEARALMEARDDVKGLALVMRFEGDLARIRLQFEEAHSLFERALGLARATGARVNMSMCRHGMAEMDRLMGRLSEAETGYREVIRLERAIGQEATIPRLNLSLCLTARGRYEQAYAMASEILETWTRSRRRGYLAVAHAALLPAAAGMGDWLAFDQHLDEYVHLAEATGMTDIDAAHNALIAGELAEAAEEKVRARRAYELAATVWEALGDPDQAAQMLDRATAMSP